MLAEADEETAEAKKLWREALAELDALKVDRDAVLAANHALNVDLRNRTADLNAAIIARDASGADYAALAASFATMRQDRDKLSQQCDLMAAEFDAKQRELDELRSARDETVAGLQAENARLVEENATKAELAKVVEWARGRCECCASWQWKIFNIDGADIKREFCTQKVARQPCNWTPAWGK